MLNFSSEEEAAAVAALAAVPPAAASGGQRQRYQATHESQPSRHRKSKFVGVSWHKPEADREQQLVQ
jgi:hypothetical protein